MPYMDYILLNKMFGTYLIVMPKRGIFLRLSIVMPKNVGWFLNTEHTIMPNACCDNLDEEKIYTLIESR